MKRIRELAAALDRRLAAWPPAFAEVAEPVDGERLAREILNELNKKKWSGK